jgi:toxin ParE1/3/4
MLIRWTAPATSDFIHICDYSAGEFGETRSRRTALQIYDAVNRLADFPHIGHVGRKPGTSELVINGLPFVAVYRHKADTVEILRILHSAQKWP